MAEASIPVELRNPGQVFACLGFLEAADVLLGDAEGGFDWTVPGDVKFILKAKGDEDPVERSLRFLAGVHAEEIQPGEIAWRADDDPKRRALVLRNEQSELTLSHWADGSSREDFKSFGGQQHAFKLVQEGQGGRPALLAEFRQLWNESPAEIISAPFKPTLPMGGSFKFDARAAWMDRDVGYSLDKQKQAVHASPVVEVFGPLGLEQARPWLDPDDRLRVRYGVWNAIVSPSLARPALGNTRVTSTHRSFEFRRNASPDGYYKQVTFAHEVESF